MKQLFVGFLLFAGLAVALAVGAAPLSQEIKDARKDAIDEMKEERAELRDEIKEARDEIKDERNEFREARKEAIKEKKCERWQNRIQNRIKRYENKHQLHERVFGNMVDRLKKVSERLKDAGLDTGDLNSYITVLEGKINDLMGEHADFIDQLEQTDEHSCGQSEGEFKNQLGEARRMIPQVRSALDEVRDYYRDVVRPELIELKQQLNDEKDDEEEESSNELKTEDEYSTSVEIVKENIQEGENSQE